MKLAEMPYLLREQILRESGERDNARQRHWLARFQRSSIVVSKAKRMVDVSLALFTSFAGNNRISGLIREKPDDKSG